ncbi:hypothetical protein MUK42_22741 [Musa troglodytarum]|uniref:Uncharacterized protein n=1 Tax=Musa troglodytarum TaxID=320322 RepID=A0A9E7K9J1_9LILI|nr:hypothetical protein MUK42_22741 [Musa troglodytarum]
MHSLMHTGIVGGLTEPDMEAAQQLLQLSSGEEDDDREGVERYQKNKKSGTGEAEASMEGELSEENRPGKRQRFRSLVAIYMVTKPIRMACNGDEKKGMRRQEE